jgi:hypothetical protein
VLDPAAAAAESGAERRRALRRALAAQWPELRVVAEDVLGAESRIDLVAVGPAGEVLILLAGEPEQDLALVARGLAQRAWVEAHLPDWLKLAPDLGARLEAGVAVLLLCDHFGAEALAAARALGPGRIAIAACHWVTDRAELRAWLAPIELEPAPEAAGPRAEVAAPPPAPEFRTGLRDEDLGLSAEEQSALGRPLAR